MQQHQILANLMLFSVSAAILLKVPTFRLSLIRQGAQLPLRSIRHVVHIMQSKILEYRRDLKRRKGKMKEKGEEKGGEKGEEDSSLGHDSLKSCSPKEVG